MVSIAAEKALEVGLLLFVYRPFSPVTPNEEKRRGGKIGECSYMKNFWA